MKTMHLPVERITNGPKHHFFGYFDKYPWDRSGRRLLAHQTSFVARRCPRRKAVIGVIENKVFTPVAETDAWCWQQGSMLQWLSDDDKIIFNDREGDGFVARILDLHRQDGNHLPPHLRFSLMAAKSQPDFRPPGPRASRLSWRPRPFLEHHPDGDGVCLLTCAPHCQTRCQHRPGTWNMRTGRTAWSGRRAGSITCCSARTAAASPFSTAGASVLTARFGI